MGFSVTLWLERSDRYLIVLWAVCTECVRAPGDYCARLLSCKTRTTFVCHELLISAGLRHSVPWTLHWCCGIAKRNQCSAATLISATCFHGETDADIASYTSWVSLAWDRFVLREIGHPVSCCRPYIDPSDALRSEVDAGKLFMIGSGINTHLF